MLVVGAAMFALGWIGGGDAKLLASAALWVGLRGLAPFAIYTALAGGLLALGLVALRSDWLRPLAAAGPAWARRLATPGEVGPLRRGDRRRRAGRLRHPPAGLNAPRQSLALGGR